MMEEVIIREIQAKEHGMYTAVPVVRYPYPEAAREQSRRFLAATLHLFGPFGRGPAFAREVFTRYPVHAEQARRAAAVVGTDPVELLAGNLCYDLLLGSNLMGCSTMALATPEGPLLARNMDWFPADKIARASCLVEEEYGTNAGFVGMIGAVTALSKKGFAVCLNAAFGGADPAGYPVLLFLRHVLDTAHDFHEALALVREERLMSGGIITLVGRTNDQRAIVERTPTKASVRTARDDQPLLATNHFRALARPEACGRYDYLAAHAGRVAELDLLTHSCVLQTITAQHVLFQPATGRTEMYVPTHLLSDDGREEASVGNLLTFLG